MKLENVSLEERSFVNEEGKTIKYYIISIPLIDGSNLELSLKGDKAKLLLLSLRVENKKD